MHTQSSLLLSAILVLAPLITILSFSTTAQIAAAQTPAVQNLAARKDLAYRGSGRFEDEYRGSGRFETAYRGSGRVTV